MKKELTIEEKREYLKDHGWFQTYDDEAWIDSSDINLTEMSTQEAFEMEKEFRGIFPESNFICGGKDMTFKRLIERVKK